VSRSALILAGGSGTRFWPASRRLRPKQLLPLADGRSLLARCVERLAPLVPIEQVWISTTAELAGAIAAELPGIDRGRILAEPTGRNTAPAIGWAVGEMPQAARAGAIAVLPSDHRIGDEPAFRATLERALVAAEAGHVVTLGVSPRWAETGFGYLELGSPVAGFEGLRRVAEFREKPDLETAQRFVASGQHVWNAGMFIFRGETLLERISEVAPELASGLAAIRAAPARATDLYPKLPSVSIDTAVMERIELAALPLDCGWDDLGSWQALYELLAGDADENRTLGEAVAVDASSNLLFADQGTIAALGVENLVVVRTGDAVLVMPRARAQEVRRIVERLRDAGRDDLL
jgi:mannose-1-phosphate guanylyltransferase